MLKVKRFVIVSLVVTLCLLIAPFHVYAYSLSQSNIKGVNVSVADYKVIGENAINTNYPKTSLILKFDLVLDKEYLGYVTGKFTCSIFGYDAQGTSQQINVDSGSKSFYVCGNTLTYYVEQTIYYPNTPTNTFTNIYTPSFTLSGSNVNSIDSFSTLASIEAYIDEILTDVNGITTYLYDSDSGTILEQVVNTNVILRDISFLVDEINTQLYDTNTYLDNLTKLRQFNIPIYSWGITIPSFQNLQLFEVDNVTLSFYEYPIFKVPNGFYKPSMAGAYFTEGDIGYLIYACTDNVQNINNYFYLSNSNYLTVLDSPTLYNFYINNQLFKVIKLKFRCNSSRALYFNINNESGKELLFCPILFYNTRYGYYFDNEFVEKFGMLDTTYKEQLDDSTDDMQSSFNDMFNYEDDFNSDMNDALEGIDVSFDVGNQLGSKFLASADWVRQQYNTLTSNTPFGTVLSFSLLLGLALLIIGKAVR